MDSKEKPMAIVTGSNTGIGRETALSLAKDGLKVFMTCRRTDRGHEASVSMSFLHTCPGADMEVLLLDLNTLESVQKCATDFESRNLPLKLLVKNAGHVTLETPWCIAEGVGGSAQVVDMGSVMSRGAKIPDPV